MPKSEDEFYIAEVGTDDNGELAVGAGEIINRKEIKPLNDPNCKHEYVWDEEDETDYYKARVCINCGHGNLIRKD